MKRIVILAVALLAGCGTIDPKTFSNRIAPTVACDKVLVVSWWKWFGIATEVDKDDSAALKQTYCAGS